MTRVKDPALLDRLHKDWSLHGCGICRGLPIELHHVKKRSQGGADSVGNIVGLCGAYSKGQHHLAVENHTVELVPSSNGFGWKDTRTGEWGYLSYPQGLNPGAGMTVPVSAVPSSGAPLALRPEVSVPESSPQDVVKGVPPAAGSSPAGKLSTPADRFAWLQEASREASRAYLTMAAVLELVKESGEWRTLGFEKWHDYYGESGLGLPSGTVSKMLKVAAFYREQWNMTIGTAVSVEKLYLAAQVAEAKDEEPSYALGLASSMPTYELRALAKGEPPPEDQPRCPECGQRVTEGYEARKHQANRRVDL